MGISRISFLDPSYWTINEENLFTGALFNSDTLTFVLAPSYLQGLDKGPNDTLSLNELNAGPRHIFVEGGVSMPAEDFLASAWETNGWSVNNPIALVQQLQAWAANNLHRPEVNPSDYDLCWYVVYGNVSGEDVIFAFAHLSNLDGEAIATGEMKLLAHFDGSALDYSGNGNHLTPAYDASDSYESAVFDDGIRLLGGSSPAIAASAENPDFQMGTGDFTIDLWAKLDGLGTNHFVGCGNSGLGGWDLYEQSGNLIFNNWTGPYAVSYSLNSVFDSGVWYHIAISRREGIVYLYVNGIEHEMGECIELDDSGADYYFHVGGYIQGSINWNMGGVLDEVRVVKGAALYSGNFTPPDQPYTPEDVVVGGMTFTDGSYKSTVGGMAFTDDIHGGVINGGSF